MIYSDLHQGEGSQVRGCTGVLAQVNGTTMPDYFAQHKFSSAMSHVNFVLLDSLKGMICFWCVERRSQL